MLFSDTIKKNNKENTKFKWRLNASRTKKRKKFKNSGTNRKKRPTDRRRLML